MLSIDEEKINALIQELYHYQTYVTVNELANIQANVSFKEQTLLAFLYELTQHQKSVYCYHAKILQHLCDSSKSYKNVDTIIQNEANKIVNKGKIRTVTNQFKTNTHVSIKGGKSILDYAKNGVCAGASASVSALALLYEKKGKYYHVDGEVGALKASGGVDAKVKLFSNKQFAPSLELKAFMSGSLANASIGAGIGNKYVSMNGELSGEVGAIDAEAIAGFSKDGLELSGEVGVAALKGEAKAVLDILGVKITVSTSGELGAIGAGAHYSMKKHELSFGVKGSCIAGLGLDIKIDY